VAGGSAQSGSCRSAQAAAGGSGSSFSAELEEWHQEDLAGTAGLTRGVVLGLVLAPLCWLLPLGIGIGMYLLLRG
jgi:hypothetical protein